MSFLRTPHPWHADVLSRKHRVRPYSPAFNPIKLAFAELKALLRRAEGRPLDGLWSWIGEILSQFSPAECRHYFRHGGDVATAA